MPLPSFFDTVPAPWQTWATPAAGVCAALLALLVGHFVLSRLRPAAGGPTRDPLDHGSVIERRASARRKNNPIELLITGAETVKEPARGWVIDRSMGGLRLLLNEEAAPGTVLNVKPRNGPPGTPWVQVEVRDCKKERSGYEVSCRFVRTPAWAVLMLFG